MNSEGGYLDMGQNEPSSSQPEAQDRSIRTVTIRQLNNARTNSPTDDTLYYDNRRINYVKLVAVIRWISDPYPTNQKFNLEDGTGTITGRLVLKHPTDDNEPGSSQGYSHNNQTKSESNDEFGDVNLDDFDNYDKSSSSNKSSSNPSWKVNMYVLVLGRVSRNNDKNGLLILHMTPVKDFNQIAYHQLKAVQEHLAITRGPPPKNGQGNQQHHQQQQQQHQQQQSYNSNNQDDSLFVSGAGSNSFAATSSSASLPTRILTFLRSRRNPEGIHQDVIAKQLNENINVIRTTLRNLTDQGDIYESTDYHYSATD